MRQVHKTETLTGVTGTWRGGTTALIDNTGANPATVAGKSIAAGESISFVVVDIGDQIQFDYDCSSGGGTTLEVTFGVREQRGAGFNTGTGKRV